MLLNKLMKLARLKNIMWFYLLLLIMLYDTRNPMSPYWDFLVYGRGGRVLSVQQESKMGRKLGGGDGYTGGD